MPEYREEPPFPGNTSPFAPNSRHTFSDRNGKARYHTSFFAWPNHINYLRNYLALKGHLIGLQKICFQKIKNQNWALIGRSVSTSTMVILIFRKICFQPRSPGGLFLFYFLVVLFEVHAVCSTECSTYPVSTGTSISPETQTRTHGQARTVACRGRCPTRRRTNR